MPRSVLTRREALMAATALAAMPSAARPLRRRFPVIDVTDLYHPHQDVGDNLDLIAAYALPEIDLRAVILDITQRFRDARPEAPEPRTGDAAGPRDPGYVPVLQLNYVFGRAVPCAAAPFEPLRSPDDALLDAPPFQQQGVELLIETLRRSREPVEIVSFGSARPIAAAWNREPALLRRKVRRVHLCAGAAPPGYLEWNVALDVHAFVRMLRCGLPVDIYPCATDRGPFSYGPHNGFWLLPDLRWVRDLHPRLRRYVVAAFERTARSDFLRAMDEEPSAEAIERTCRRPHNVWETCVWMRVADRRLVRRADGSHRIVPAAEVRPDDRVLPNEMRPVEVTVRDDGHFDWRPASRPTPWRLYDRGDPRENEAALREALPALYLGFAP